MSAPHVHSIGEELLILSYRPFPQSAKVSARAHISFKTTTVAVITPH